MHFIFNIKKKKKNISKKKPQASIALLMNGKITIHNPRKKVVDLFVAIIRENFNKRLWIEDGEGFAIHLST